MSACRHRVRTRFVGCLAGTGLLFSPLLASAQQESPLTEEMLEASRAEKKAATDREVGAAYRDNPAWLADQLDAEKKAAEQAELDAEGDEKAAARYLPGYRHSAGVGLSPLAPQQQSVVPGGVTPVMGAPVGVGDLTFEFHGYLQAGLRAGIGERDQAYEGQQETTLHGDPVVPGSAFGWFDHTNTVPVPWAQLNFSVGNDVLEATAILGAWSMSESDQAAGYFQPPAQLGFYDAYLTYTPDIAPVGLRLQAGVFNERYGGMAKYSSGAYGAALIAQIYGVGAASTVTLPFENDVTLTLEGGFKGDFNNAPAELVLDQSKEFAPVVEGSTYAAHGHVAFDFDTWVELTGHAIYSFSQDDRSDELVGEELYTEGQAVRKDGSLRILGADARFKLRHVGHLYVGGSQVVAKNSLTLSNLVQVLNNGPGRDLVRRYFSYDSGGNGKLTLVGGQYDVSLGRLLRHPVEFSGIGPDLDVSLFGIYGHQENDGDVFPEADMLKFGTELTYSPLSWLAVSGRFDMVKPDLERKARDFAVITPKLVFRNDWSNQATLTLQYSAYLLGDEVVVNGDERLLNNPSGEPDSHLLALYGTIWW